MIDSTNAANAACTGVSRRIDQPNNPAERAPLTALVVNQESGTSLKIAQLLRPTVSNVFLAADAQQAKELLHCQPIDVMITEFALTDGSGLSLLAEGRRLRPQLQTIVVASKSRVGIEDVMECYRLGAADFVLKPMIRSAVQTALGRALQRRQGAHDFPLPVPAPELPGTHTVNVPLGRSLKQIQRHLVEETVLRFDGNKSAAAKALGMHRKSLYRMLKSNC
jgi:DNA-binding NtrC family response regulator